MKSENLLPKLEGKGLFAFSDPSGAKSVLSYIKLNPYLKDCKVISDRKYDFFEDYKIDVEDYIPGTEDKLLNEYKPDFLYLGTSYYATTEFELIKAANKKGIPSYSFIDHYTNFKERYSRNNEIVFPSFFCVLDERAFEIGVRNGFPKEKIIITPNPYHLFLKNWRPNLTKAEFLLKVEIPNNKKIILYAPDPLTNLGGKEFYGIDEITVWQDLLDSLCKLEYSIKQYVLIIKLHPNQQLSKILPVLNISKDKIDFIIADNSFHTNTLLYYSDLVIGMFSNILIESSILGRNTIRHLNNLKETDPLHENNLGIITHSNFELEKAISNMF